MSEFKWRSGQIKWFWYWINERNKIYHIKKSGSPFPWTKDKILREYKFTNVYRQLDRVTEEWTNRYSKLLGGGKKMKDGDVLFHCCMFRLFNWPETFDALYHGLGTRGWSLNRALEILRIRKEEDHEKIFTGAYIIPNGGRDDPKFQVIAEALDYVYKNRHKYAEEIREHRTMQHAVEVLERVPTVGGFIGYEIACDLRHTRLLYDATDVNSWANPGPGAKRGINRLLYGAAKIRGKKPDYIQAMRALLVMAKDEFVLSAQEHHAIGWPFEMREIEHSLCEYDKYMRVKNDEGRPRSIYRPPKPKQEELFDDEE